MNINETFSGSDSPLGGLGQENAVYLQTHPDGRVSAWAKIRGEWSITGDLIGPPSSNSGPTIYRANALLSDAQIKTLPSSPIAVVAATETLGYAGFPTTIPIIQSGIAILNATAGAYANITGDGSSFLLLAYGSDWSLNASMLLEVGLVGTDPAVIFGKLDNQARKSFYPFSGIGAGIVYEGGLQDNGIAIAANNPAGNFTLGHSSNTLRVIVDYFRVPLP